MFVEYRHGIPFAFAVPDLAAAIKRDGLKQSLGQVGTSFGHFVVDGHGTDQSGESSRLRGRQAHQSNDIAAVGMVKLPLRALRRACLEVGGRDKAHVAHMSQQMTSGVLRDRIAQMAADTPERRGVAGYRVLARRETRIKRSPLRAADRGKSRRVSRRKSQREILLVTSAMAVASAASVAASISATSLVDSR